MAEHEHASFESTGELRPLPFIVGIGASAGGLESLKALLPGLPERAAACYVVLQHLAPTHRSMLVEIGGGRTKLCVREVHDGDPPEAGVVFVTPPNSHIEFDGLRFRLTEPAPQSLPRPSINLFFASLAEHASPACLGVVLSGTGSDGAMGVRQIVAAGGQAMVQLPESARYTGMPEAANRALGREGSGLAPEALGEAIARVALSASAAPGAHADFRPDPLPTMVEDQFTELLMRLRRRSGVDFRLYKEATLLRRLDRRLQVREAASLADYLRLVDQDPAELDQLARDSLISVTGFWRDPTAFDALVAALRERLRLRHEAEAPLRVWVAGCATGEEAYSVLMAYAEAMGRIPGERDLQMFATDVDPEALVVARHGLYPAGALVELPAALQERYFLPVGAQLEFSRALRERVVFSRHDLTRDPPFPRLDLISCRNVLIYLKPDAHSLVLQAFHYALRPQGLMMLGRSESVLHHEALFPALDKEQRLFVRGAVQATPGMLAMARGAVSGGGGNLVVRPGALIETELNLLREAADRYLPPCVLLDERFQVLQVHGDVSPFFGLRPGLQSFNVLTLARAEVEADLRLLCALGGEQERARHSDMTLTQGRRRQGWRVTLHPFSGPPGRRRALLAFERRSLRQRGEVTDPSVAVVQADLAEAREHLKALVSQLEASNQEMMALNEEAQAANEELQASNEELEAANEEMQATNQELATVNAELNHQWRRYQQLSQELQSIQNSIDLPMLVVDTALAIRRFNEAAAMLFRLSPGCEGLHLSTISRPAGMADFCERVRQAQASASAQVLNLPPAEDGREFVLHLSHHVVGQERAGVVLTLVDNTELARAERQTRSVERRLRAVMNHSGSLVAIKDAGGRYEFANERYCRFLGLAPGLLIEHTDAQCLAAPLAAQLRQGDLDTLRSTGVLEREESFDVAGERHHWWASRLALTDESGAAVAVCVQAVDLTDWRRADEDLRIAARILDVTSEGVLITDAEQNILHVNAAFTRITGYTEDEVRGKRPRLLSSGRQDATFYERLWQQVARSGGWQGEIWNRNKAGEDYLEWLTISALRDEAGVVSHFVGVFSDISVLAESRQRIEQLATHDALTGLPNRSLLLDRLGHAVETARRAGTELALCFIDLDNFKNVNDSLGHDAGDELLRQATRRITDNVRTADTVARLGGDEFVLLIERTSRHECLQTVERIVKTLGEETTLHDTRVSCAASVGIALFPSDGEDAAALMRNADAAMYRAKRAGRGRCEFFSSEVGESARSRLALESGLRQAIGRGEMCLHYQPQMDPSGRACVGVEALLRWQTRQGEWIAPSLFLPVAEDSSLIDSLGDWVLDVACAQLARWRQRGLMHLTLSVNVSARQLRDRQFADRLQAHLMHHQVPGSRLILEVTESALLHPGEHLTPLLRRLHALEVQLSLDDFGTGYSSLAHLRQLPIHELKIDRSFVQGMTDQRDDREIVAAIVGLAGGMGLRVVAEGVETEAQCLALQRQGPLLLQGHLLARPQPPEALTDWLLEKAPRKPEPHDELRT